MPRGIKPTKENLMNIPHYRSIINLLITFQDYKDGLEQKHFRYALIKDHDKQTNSNLEGLNNISIKEMEGFFKGDIIKSLSDSEAIENNCITSRNNLNGFLNRLIELGVVNKDKKGKYHIDKKCFLEGIRISNKRTLDYYPTEEIKEIKPKPTAREYQDIKNLIKEGGSILDKADDFESGFSYYIYGFSRNMYKDLSHEERKIIMNHFNKIEEYYQEIQFILAEYKEKKKYKGLVNFSFLRCPDLPPDVTQSLISDKKLITTRYYNGLWFEETKIGD